MPPPCVTFRCAAAARIHPQPFLFVRASWLSRRISSHCLCLLTRRRLTTGCVVAIVDAQASFVVVAIAIVTLVTSRRAGVIVLVIVVVDFHRHRRRCCIPLRRCHGHRRRRRRPLRHCHYRRLRRPLHRRHRCRCVVDVVLARRAVTILICEGCKKVTWLNGLFNTYQFVR